MFSGLIFNKNRSITIRRQSLSEKSGKWNANSRGLHTCTDPSKLDEARMPTVCGFHERPVTRCECEFEYRNLSFITTFSSLAFSASEKVKGSRKYNNLKFMIGIMIEKESRKIHPNYFQ